MELLPVSEIEGALERLGARAREQWRNLLAPRPPLVLGERRVRLDQPQVVGILNVTPDSFSDGGRHEDQAVAAEAGFAMAAAGAAMI
ncbi:MAG TPA: dihydropteroate synthase, partial [Allosphingosinicella sp.]|nr:dihydropteroate synthase [Allosphingosinicella sp.]